MYIVKANAPIAFDSKDHLFPFSAIRDNSVNLRFNAALYAMFNNLVSVMDLGCAGGGFVKSLLDEGHDAIGLDGSDVNRRLQRAEWKTIPSHLFTCDISRPFVVLNEREQFAQFDCITAWEVLEHIPAERLDTLVENIRRHLKPDGILVCTISSDPGHNTYFDNIEMHETIQPPQWWIDRLRDGGLTHRPDLLAQFGGQFVRMGSHPYVFTLSK